MEVFFGIPTYKRSEKQPTLDYLERIGIDRQHIIMSVQTESDYKAYLARGYRERVGKLVFRAGNNVSDNRNTILDNTPKGVKIVILDDDIKAICKLCGDHLRNIETLDELQQFLGYGYRIAAKHKTVGFSVYPCHNAYFMSNGYTTRNIGEGTLLALTNIGMRFDSRFSTKEDYELSCRIIRRFGAFPRLNNYCCNAPHYTKGGCEEAWKDRQEHNRTAKRLVGMYPDILELNKRRIGEVKMRRSGK